MIRMYNDRTTCKIPGADKKQMYKKFNCKEHNLLTSKFQYNSVKCII